MVMVKRRLWGRSLSPFGVWKSCGDGEEGAV